MNKGLKASAAALVTAAMLAGCASGPKSIKAAYASPVKYEGLDCSAIAVERLAIEDRAGYLYNRLDKRADTDAVKMGVGVALFLPALFFLKGNGPQAAELASLKGNYQALRYRSEAAGCDLSFVDLDRKPAKIASAR